MRKDLVASIGLLLIAAFYYAAATTIQQSTLEDEVGPTGLPTVLAAVLALLAIAIGVRALVSAPSPAAKAELKEAEAPWPRALGMLAIGALYLPVVSIVGYPLALFLLLVAVALYERKAPDWRVFAVALMAAGFFWLIFERVLGVRQPEGLLF
jgi:putative tricarboxylic transport membrane protein